MLAYYLSQRVYANSSAVTEEMLDDYYTVSHQPGAKWVPTSFVSAYLNRDISKEFAALPHPMYIIWGRQAQFTPVSRAGGFLALRPDVPLEVFDYAGLVVADEQPEAFVRLAQRVLG
jgi:pimeloyl-ACP methyl ester carboxylesterase